MSDSGCLVNISGVAFKRNGVLASGILGVTGWSMVRVAKSGAGGITCKSISCGKRKGHPTPVIQPYEHGVLNAVGLSSTGIENSNMELSILRKNSDSVIIASIFGSTEREFAETAELLDNRDIDIIELNISCPNVHDEFGLPFSSTPESAGRVVECVRERTKLPLFAKLSPNFPKLGDIAKACEAKGANGITAINTVGPGMLIDINTFSPKLSNKMGGVSGPAILPVAIRAVYEIYRAVNIPIIGMGGITGPEDAIQMILAGATLYGVGTAILYKGVEIFEEINSGINSFLKDKGLTYGEIIGRVHKN